MNPKIIEQVTFTFEKSKKNSFKLFIAPCTNRIIHDHHIDVNGLLFYFSDDFKVVENEIEIDADDYPAWITVLGVKQIKDNGSSFLLNDVSLTSSDISSCAIYDKNEDEIFLPI